MAKFIVNNRAGVILPGAEAVSPHGSEINWTGENPAVDGWIKSGLLVAPKDFARPVAASSDAKTQAALDKALADLADRDATIAKLTADLEAATKPADPAK